MYVVVRGGPAVVRGGPFLSYKTLAFRVVVRIISAQIIKKRGGPELAVLTQAVLYCTKSCADLGQPPLCPANMGLNQQPRRGCDP